MLISSSRFLFNRPSNFLQKPFILKGLDVTVKSYSVKINTGVIFVPHKEAWVVERMGKFYRVLEPGVNFLIPFLDKIKYVQILKEIAIEIPKQSAITFDNVTLNIDGVLYLKVLDPYLASYGVEDPEYAITQLAQTSMRSELGKISLDRVFAERENLNNALVEVINKASSSWGISCLRYEIRDITVPQAVREAMQLQVEAERKKRAAILESEGMRAADINVAEGKRQSRILASEAEQIEQINKADGEAKALLTVSQARAKGLEVIAKSLRSQDGKNAASLNVALQYVSAFSQLAQKGNTLILPSNVNDVSQVVAQAMTIYNKINQLNQEDLSSIEGSKYYENNKHDNEVDLNGCGQVLEKNTTKD